MNILFIGNSFSEDSTKYLKSIAGDDITERVLFIGACSLETHWKNFCENEATYVYEKEAESIGKIKLKDALTDMDWDIIVLQQYSQVSGVLDSYEPYIGNLIAGIKEICPNARFVFNRTWAYEDGDAYMTRYDSSRHKMFSEILKATNTISEKYGLDIIPCGDAIEEARALSECIPESEYCMTRDGHHLSMEYGRYLAALVCYVFFTKKSAKDVTFEPKNTNPELNKKLRAIADKVSR